MIERESIRMGKKKEPNEEISNDDLKEMVDNCRREMAQKDIEIGRLKQSKAILEEEFRKLENENDVLKSKSDSPVNGSGSKQPVAFEREVKDLKELLKRVKAERDDLLLEKEKVLIYGINPVQNQVSNSGFIIDEVAEENVLLRPIPDSKFPPKATDDFRYPTPQDLNGSFNQSLDFRHQ